ncbi:hypothetical protein DFH09DRAFT_1100110 [Mycena vulgaris]|nr:hypothetical protein DFH09DRAFT_1100110 [Mycena vulgaris]
MDGECCPADANAPSLIPAASSAVCAGLGREKADGSAFLTRVEGPPKNPRCSGDLSLLEQKRGPRAAEEEGESGRLARDTPSSTRGDVHAKRAVAESPSPGPNAQRHCEVSIWSCGKRDGDGAARGKKAREWLDAHHVLGPLGAVAEFMAGPRSSQSSVARRRHVALEPNPDGRASGGRMEEAVGHRRIRGEICTWWDPRRRGGAQYSVIALRAGLPALDASRAIAARRGEVLADKQEIGRQGGMCRRLVVSLEDGNDDATQGGKGCGDEAVRSCPPVALGSQLHSPRASLRHVHR